MGLLNRMLQPFLAMRARQQFKKALPRYRKAESHFLEMDVDRAVQELSVGLQIDPSNPRGYLRRGDFYLIRGLDDLAINDFTYVIKLDGAIRKVAYRNNWRDAMGRSQDEQDLAEAFRCRGQVYLSRGEFDLALADLNSAIEIGYARAAVLLRPGDFFQGRRNALLHDFSQAAELFSIRGEVLHANEQHAAAIFDFDVAILHGTEARNVSWALNKKGLALESLGEFERAIQNFDEALANYPLRLDTDREIAEVLRNRGRSHHQRSEYDLAVSDFRTAQLVESLELDEHRDRTKFFFRIGEYAQAHSECNLHINAYPEDKYGPEYEIYSLRGEVRLAMGDYEPAISDLDVAHPLEEMCPALDGDMLAEYFNRRGLANMGRRQFDLAIADFNEAIDIDPDSAVPTGTV